MGSKEGEIDARVCCRLYIGKLRLRPIFIVAHINVGLGIEQQSGPAGSLEIRAARLVRYNGGVRA